MGKSGTGIRRGVGRNHTARRMERAFGYGALAGLGLLGVSIVIGIVLGQTGGSMESPFFLAPLGAGTVLTAGGWILWGSWSATLDNYSEPLSLTAKMTLGAVALLVVGVVALFGAGLPIALYADTDPPPSWVIPTVVAGGSVAALCIAVAIVGSAVAGGIALGGLRWWWAGVLLSAGIAAAAAGWVLGDVLLLLAGVAALVGAVIGYHRALRAGLAAKRTGAIEAEQYRRRR